MKKRSSETLGSSQRPRSFRRSKWKSENVDPNTHFLTPLIAKSPASAARIRSPFLPPRPPPSNPNRLKRKLSAENEADYGGPPVYDSGVKVIVRIRPTNKEEEGEKIVKKTSDNSLSIDDRVFTFDSVADEESSQQEIFHLVGIPLVENCLAGFNSSVFAYGQTGSGKTYTMWGPANALAEENTSSNQQGLTFLVFEQLFARINEEQVKHAEKKLEYQCRCSFLEIYNEQITDLLDPDQRNLQIREDVRSGVYVENLQEEYVCTMKDLKQLLIKGLANRRTGATNINVDSSRSHSVFTCVVESRCKSMTDGLSSVRISRINFVDLAGSERQKLTGASGGRLKEAGSINRSLSQLGNLINILAEVSQSGKQRHIPYRDSRLTFLLQESLGGNAKLAMICAISPAKRCKSETFSTLRFAHRAKDIKNKAIVNEIMEDDVNLLREQIRQLKDELLRTKSNENSMDCNGGYSTGWNARRSLSLLRLSLNRPMTLPHVEDDSDEEMEIDEENERLSIQVGLELAAYEESKDFKAPTTVSNITISETKFSNPNTNNISESSCASFQGIEEVDVNMEECQLDKIASDQIDISNGNADDKHIVHTNINTLDEVSAGELITEKSFVCTEFELLNSNEPVGRKSSRCLDFHSIGGDYSDIGITGSNSVGTDSVVHINSNSKLVGVDSYIPSSHTNEKCQFSPAHQPPTLSISTKVTRSRKSRRTLSMSSASQKGLPEDIMFTSEDPKLSFALPPGSSSYKYLSSPRSKNDPLPTENLEASLHRGLQSIECHLHDSALRRSSFRSVKPVDLEQFFSVGKVDVGLQTLMQDSEIPEDSSALLCSSCKGRNVQLEVSDMKELQSVLVDPVPVDGSQLADKSRKQVPKAVEKVLVGAIRREMALEEFCSKLTAEIAQLNHLVQQYKHESECNAIIEQTREDKISRLECLLDGVLPIEEFLEKEFVSVKKEYKLLKEKYESHPEVLRTNIELKRVEDELDGYRNFFDMGERDVLMEEIQYLRSQLQYYIDSLAKSTRKPSSLLMLAPPSTIPESSNVGPEEKFEGGSHRTEMEGKRIFLSEELRVELETNRSLAEKWKQELDSEKKCTEELKEELQRAIQNNARIIDQYSELNEQHVTLLSRNRKLSDGIADVKRAARKAGVKCAESRFINSIAAEISSLKVEREKESRYLREENTALQVQLRDTAEAVQAAGELLVRLKEAEEAVSVAQKRASVAEGEAKKACEEVEKLKEKHEREINTLNQFLAESRLPEEALKPAYNPSDTEKCDRGENLSDQQWKEEFEQVYSEGDSEFEPSSWFSGHDRCNI